MPTKLLFNLHEYKNLPVFSKQGINSKLYNTKTLYSKMQPLKYNDMHTALTGGHVPNIIENFRKINHSRVHTPHRKHVTLHHQSNELGSGVNHIHNINKRLTGRGIIKL